ncbi:3'-5' exonuclease [Sporomusa sp. KB1]|uniref:3'-5' exonuclease n=1 Tax=Sporomusa sp. KB1 TaxID=943346 RepID=UPI0011AC8760|nr:3'-5' exonuclease [Sporomusa sp. KB1]TWH45012.1 DNA polymerase-3 subunit epsilon [Sporomusa sp. KB1]
MRKNFIAFDFETANLQSHSACQLGVAVVAKGRIVMEKSWLIRPPTKVFTFSYLHGITYSMVRNQPTFVGLWPEIRPFFEHQIVAAHNADFDIGVLAATLAHYGLFMPEFFVIDSLAVARSAWPKLRNHKLSTVAAHLNVALTHHDAGSDAKACAEIILRAGQQHVEINHVINRPAQESLDLFGGDY